MTGVVIQAAHVPWQEAVIERIRRQTMSVTSFFLRPQNWRSFQAGQHLDVQLTAQDGYVAQRSYSVASAPGLEGLYELVVERLEGGEVSPFLHDVAEVGDTIEIRGPFGGHFAWIPRTADLSFSSAAAPGSRRSCRSCATAPRSVPMSQPFFFTRRAPGTT